MGEDHEASFEDKDVDQVTSSQSPATSLFYYQNPTTGTVSATPLSLKQLVKLLVPIREGMSAILPPHTNCLEVATHPNSESENAAMVGEWKQVSTVDVLKEAACAQWYLTGGQMNRPDDASSATTGPMSCRSLFNAYNQAEDKSKLLAFAADITPEWTPVEKLPMLLKVLEALQPDSIPSQTDPVISNSESNWVDSTGKVSVQDIKDELEAFLSSTAVASAENDDDDGHGYESDGGTRYIKDPFSGHWIHEALAPPSLTQPPPSNNSKAKPPPENTNTTNASKKSHKKAKFAKRNARHWIYVTGLPTTVTDMGELQKFFSKAGLLDLDPETLQPKIKLYRHADGTLKGDASVCYARPESVDLALQVLDESLWDEKHTIRIERAKFEAKEGESTKANNKRERKNISQAQRKVARLALLQAQDEGFGERLAGGRKGLRIVVVQHMLDEIPEDEWESTIQDRCKELDVLVEKITCISKTKVVIVKFLEPTAASQAVEAWNGKPNPKTQVSMVASYWDGVTDYTQSQEDHNPEEEEKRHEDFGKWLDDQGMDELPPELQLQVAKE